MELGNVIHMEMVAQQVNIVQWAVDLKTCFVLLYFMLTVSFLCSVITRCFC